MKRIIRFLLVGFLILSCGTKAIKTNKSGKKIGYNETLAKELSEMAKIDQIAALMPKGDKYRNFSKDKWKLFQDSVFKKHQRRIEEIFNQYGFVGYDLAGIEGSRNFWLSVQHSDNNPKFQKEVLKKMEIEVDNKNADPSEYAFLVDRVKINFEKKQFYGTQVEYNSENGQAYPKKLNDSVNVDKRRKSMGLPPLKTYLNRMSRMHFEMNKDLYLSKGIKEPKLY